MKVNGYNSVKRSGFLFQACLIGILMAFVSTSKAASQGSGNPEQFIKIGLLIKDSTYVSAIQGAELAIRIANEKGGLNGSKFQLVVRSMEGPWGTGSKQAIDLIFNEKVWALLGSNDGRNAHLVEQAATKSTVVFVSAWSGDPTLSQAFVPWFFNCVPNDNQQSASLIDEIYNKRNLNKIVVVFSNNYDSKTRLNSFLKSVKMSGLPDPVQFSYDNYIQKINLLVEEINASAPDCIVLFSHPSASLELAKHLRQKTFDKPLFGSITVLNENELSAQELQYFDDFLAIPSGDWTGSENQIFRQEFQKTYKRTPGMVASYSYDGMNIMIEAIKNAGIPDREMIQQSLKNMHYKGVTGPIKFDDKGNRLGNFKIMKTRSGLPLTSG